MEHELKRIRGDSFNSFNSCAIIMKKETAQKILEETERSYNSIATDFNQTRNYLWPGLKDFKKYIKSGDKILDLGCGNGKLRLLFKETDIDYVGVDNSSELLKIAEKRLNFKLPRQKFIKANILNLPFPDNSFDVVFFVAVLHHIPSKIFRQQVLREIRRVLKPNGILIMTNWNRYQKRGPQLKYIIKYTLLKIIGRSELDFKDTYLPWMGGKAYRYYHAFTLGELRKLVEKSGLKIQENYLAYWRGKKASRLAYSKAANLVTIAKKC